MSKTFPDTGTPEGETITKEVQAKESKKEEGIGDDLELYYKVYNRYKPEAGESNAESAARNCRESREATASH